MVSLAGSDSNFSGSDPRVLSDAATRLTAASGRLRESGIRLRRSLDEAAVYGSNAQAYHDLGSLTTALDQSAHGMQAAANTLKTQATGQAEASKKGACPPGGTGARKKKHVIRPSTIRRRVWPPLPLKEVKNEDGTVAARPKLFIETWMDPATGKVMAKFRNLKQSGFEDKRGWKVTLDSEGFYEVGDGYLEAVVGVSGLERMEDGKKFSSKDASEQSITLPEVPVGLAHNTEGGYDIGIKKDIPCNSTVVVRVGSDGVPSIFNQSNGCDDSLPTQKVEPSSAPSSASAVRQPEVDAGTAPPPAPLHPARAGGPQHPQTVPGVPTTSGYSDANLRALGRAASQEAERRHEIASEMDALAPGWRSLLSGPPTSSPEPKRPPR